MRLFLMVMFSVSTSWAGGDLIGGGSLQRFALSPQEVSALQNSPDVNNAYQKWLNSKLSSPANQEKLLRDVFESLILPQIQKQ